MKNKLSIAILVFLLSMFSASTIAVAGCQAPPVLMGVTLKNKLHGHGRPYTLPGTYDVNLAPTLDAIRSGAADQGGFPYRYMQHYNCSKPGMPSSPICFEYTVSPNLKDGRTKNNFKPDEGTGALPITDALLDKRNTRDPFVVRIVTGTVHGQRMYSYTLNHYRSYCGPFPLN